MFSVIIIFLVVLSFCLAGVADIEMKKRSNNNVISMNSFRERKLQYRRIKESLIKMHYLFKYLDSHRHNNDISKKS